MDYTYLTTEALAQRIHYDARTIRDRLKDSVLLEGRHYFRPFGGRKILYIWETIERDMMRAATKTSCEIGTGRGPSALSNEPRDSAGIATDVGIPMAGGGVCNG